MLHGRTSPINIIYWEFISSCVRILARLLQEDPVLFQLYKDLVVANVITAEEFWTNRFTVSVYCYADA